MSSSKEVSRHGSYSYEGGAKNWVLFQLGSSINLSVERFLSVSESIFISSQNHFITACTEARLTGGKIEELCNLENKSILLNTARNLLASITRVLLLTDAHLVKTIIGNKRPNSFSLSSIRSFIEFVHSFTSFGREMIELGYFCDGNEAKYTQIREQMDCAQKIILKSSSLLLSSAQTVCVHSNCGGSREIRDTVFCQMRRGLDLTHYLIKESIISSELIGNRKRVTNNLHDYLFEFRRIDSPFIKLNPEELRTEMPKTLSKVMERIQDFTDSAYTKNESRECILLLCDRIKLQLNQLLRISLSNQKLDEEDTCLASEYESAREGILRSVQELKKQLEDTTFSQVKDIEESCYQYENLIQILKNSAIVMDNDRLEESIEVYTEYFAHVQEICCLLRHISPSISLSIRSKYLSINTKVYGSLLPLSSRLLSSFPTSLPLSSSLHNLTLLLHWLLDEFKRLGRDVQTLCSLSGFYSSLPNRGKHGTTQKPLKSSPNTTKPSLRPEDGEGDGPAEEIDKSEEDIEKNEILKIAKLMSSLCLNMHDFTRGVGECKTTQDLFTHGEYFTEEANKLYKLLRQFSYMVPSGLEKKNLLEKVDEVPKRVQQLQFIVKNPTVGKAATFTKVDSIISDSKSFMDLISQVVTICFEIANKYKLDFSTISGRRSGYTSRSESEEMIGLGTSSDNNSKNYQNQTSDHVS